MTLRWLGGAGGYSSNVYKPLIIFNITHFQSPS